MHTLGPWQLSSVYITTVTYVTRVFVIFKYYQTEPVLSDFQTKYYQTGCVVYLLEE